MLEKPCYKEESLCHGGEQAKETGHSKRKNIIKENFQQLT